MSFVLVFLVFLFSLLLLVLLIIVIIWCLLYFIETRFSQVDFVVKSYFRWLVLFVLDSLSCPVIIVLQVSTSTAKYIQYIVIILHHYDAKDYELDGYYWSDATPHFNITLQVFQLFFSQVSLVLRNPLLCEVISHIEEGCNRNNKHEGSTENDLVLHWVPKRIHFN